MDRTVWDRIRLLNTMIDDVVAKRWPGAVRLTRSASRKKTGAFTFATGGGGLQRYLPPILRVDMATPTTIALDSSFHLLLISRILVDKDGNCQHHVIMWGSLCTRLYWTKTEAYRNFLYEWITYASGCALVITRRGGTTHSGVKVNNAHISMTNPLNIKRTIFSFMFHIFVVFWHRTNTPQGFRRVNSSNNICEVLLWDCYTTSNCLLKLIS